MHLSLAGMGVVNFCVVYCVLLVGSLRGDVTVEAPSAQFLWAGSDGTFDTLARVSWSTVIRPQDEEALGIIDRKIKSRVLISKLIVRGLFRGNEPWIAFLRSAIVECTPRGRGDW